MSEFKYGILGFVLGFAATFATSSLNNYHPFVRSIPRAEQVQQGYIAPSRLEIECKDLDGNGEPETIMKIGDKPYLLREVDGKPILSAYEIKPAEIQYKTK